MGIRLFCRLLIESVQEMEFGKVKAVLINKEKISHDFQQKFFLQKSSGNGKAALTPPFIYLSFFFFLDKL